MKSKNIIFLTVEANTGDHDQSFKTRIKFLIERSDRKPKPHSLTNPGTEKQRIHQRNERGK